VSRPGGTGVVAGPTAVIFPPLMTTTPFSIARPVPSMTGRRQSGGLGLGTDAERRGQQSESRFA
jgi:hypothetical protein